MTDQAPTGAPGQPLITLVVSVYGVEDYLPAFLDSVDELDFDRNRLEIVFVDDGSTDHSADLIAAWIERQSATGGPGTPAVLIAKTNGGLSSARNFGLARARGEWISFPDPDDVLSVAYLKNVAAFVDGPEAARVSMVATRMVQFVDDPAQPIARHMLDFKFDQPARVVDLSVSPRYVHVHAATAFYRLSAIHGASLTFDERVAPVFEDGVFTGHYLLEFTTPTVAFLGLTPYYYRKRESQSSLTDTAWSKPGRYDAILQYGYLELFAKAGAKAPVWLQNIVFYDLQWYPKADERNMSPTASISPATQQRFFDLLDQSLQHLDDDTFLRFTSASVPIHQRYAFLALKNGRVPPHEVGVIRLDRAQEILLLRYYTLEAEPAETIRVDGVPTPPVFAKTTALTYFGRTWLYERDLWVTALEPVSLEVDGQLRRLQLGGVYQPVFEAMPEATWKRFLSLVPPHERDWDAPRTSAALAGNPVDEAFAPSAEPPRDGGPDRPEPAAGTRRTSGTLARLEKALRRRLSRLRRVTPRPQLGTDEELDLEARAARLIERAARKPDRRTYRRAWVLIDRDTLAQDNAEAFYRYLKREQPTVNAWFVLNRDAPDWDRLEAEGFRLIEHGSDEHVVVMLNAKYLISSQIDRYIVRPLDPLLYPERGWKYVFLQHGVTKDDLSRWINGKPIRTMITATRAEQESIVSDGSPYRWSEKEVVLTGFPRHDTLSAKAERLAPGERRSLLIMPTWRDDLLDSVEGTNDRRLRSGFEESAYARAWFGLLRSPELAEAAAVRGVDIVFAAHPNLQDHIDESHLPAHVRLMRYRDSDVQEVIARAQLMVTDYSSLAFEAAYLRTPVVYFQFDAEEFFSGAHAYRRGYYSYADDGFGPVVGTVDEAVETLVSLLADPASLAPEYVDRIEQVFPFRDGQNSRRVFEAIIEREHSRVRPQTP